MPDLFIGGRWISARAGGRREIRCPADGSLVAVVDEADARDTEAAIGAARAAFDDGPWPHTPVRRRGELLRQVADLLIRDRAEIARAESLDTGKRLVESEYDVDDVTAVFAHYASVAIAEGEAEEAAGAPGRPVDVGRDDVHSRVLHEPVGVCSLITPWNYPLLQVAWKVAPCLAAGNTFVLKPSELTPHSAMHLMRLLAEAGLPPGAGNLVLGAGNAAGDPLSKDGRVDLVSFTGGLHTGKALMRNAADTVKRIALELGGKNPNIVFADVADSAESWEAALDNAVTAVFLHSGQVCSAGARLLVQAEVHDEFVDQLVARAAEIRLGGPFDPDAQTGALISADHLARVEAYVAEALAEGAVLRTGGARVNDGDLAAGYFFGPTVLDRCHTEMACVQQESFGPVLTVESFVDADEAVRLANDSIYGLAGAVWTRDADLAERVAARLRMGTVWINDFHPYVPQAEWGGYKQSGIGRELGEHGLAEYRETKHVWRRAQPQPSGWWE